MNRSIQAEGGFADIKGDSGFTRFLCKGNENVFAEYIFVCDGPQPWVASQPDSKQQTGSAPL